jgi:excisionase family DNA binding protein
MARTKTPPKIDPADRLMSVNEIASYCGVHRARVYQLMRDGALPYVTVGSRRRVKMSDLLAYLDLAS